MHIILENWELISVVALAVIAFVVKAIQVFKKPSEERKKLIKLFLVDAVELAEAKIGPGNGHMKYDLVYAMFIKRYKWFGKFISKKVFSRLVDEVLNVLRQSPKSNVK